jgi:hypothetical protein
MSWRRVYCGTCKHILIISEFWCLVSVVRPLWREVRSVSCQSLSAIIVHRQVLFFFCPFFLYNLHVTRFMYMQYMQGLSSPVSTALYIRSRSWSYFTTDSQSVSQHVLVSSTLLGLATRYYFLSECWCLEFAVLYLWGAREREREREESWGVVVRDTTVWRGV